VNNKIYIEKRSSGFVSRKGVHRGCVIILCGLRIMPGYTHADRKRVISLYIGAYYLSEKGFAAVVLNI